MRTMLIALALVGSAVPTAAQLTTKYSGVQRDGEKETPASAQFAVDNGRAVMVMKGTKSARMLFLAKEQVLRIVNDDEKNYVDLDKETMASLREQVGMMADAQKQLEQLPPAQRQMAEQMMKQRMAASKSRPPLTYVWTKEKHTIAGYECTMVNGMRGDDKVTEYCGTTSRDFNMTDSERSTMLNMQGYLRNFLITLQGDDDAARAFQWDTGADGFPVITRCFSGGKITLDLTLGSVSHEPIPGALFELPKDYKKLEMPGRPRRD